jgi:DNA invertase Pin-like site-specific DNA recombinase
MTWLGYTRVSRVGEREKNNTLISPADQAERIEAYANAHGKEVDILDPELDVSGGKIDRPILNQAIERIERGEADGLIVAQLDRLSRAGIEDSLKVIRRIEAGSGQVIAVAENFDDSTPEGRMTRNVMLSVGEMQLDRHKEQFMRAKRRSVREGIWPMPVVPIGYRRTRKKDGGDGKLNPSKDAGKVKEAFAARVAGKPWREVAGILGAGLSGAQRVIANPVYLGETHLQVHGEKLKAGTHEPLVDRGTWEAAQSERRPRVSIPEDGPALLAGITRCAGCSRTMSLSKGSDGYQPYRCHTRNSATGTCRSPALISKGLVEPYVEELIVPWLDKVFVKSRPRTEHLAAAMDALEEEENELATYQKAIKGLPAEQLAEGLRERLKTVEEARQKVKDIQRASAPVALAEGSLADAWGEMSIPERSYVLRAALGVVWVNKGRGEVGSRVRAIEAGFEPKVLSRPGRGGDAPIVSVPDGKLEGQILPLGG